MKVAIAEGWETEDREGGGWQDDMSILGGEGE